jgi:3-phenylpropionate/trans-cinnamate dioxygenase ferredoxin reductase subunit
MTEPIIVIGGGLAAGHAVTGLRDLGHDGAVVVLADEPHPPYERPPLSKALLRGKKPAASTYLHPPTWYAAHRVELRTGARVVRLDPPAHMVETDDGQSLAYSRLLLATGARARRLPLEPTAAIEVCYLRTLDDAARLRALLGPGQRLLVVGGGWIGMEVAASARQLDTAVTLVEPAGQPLAALGPEVGARFAASHRDHGVDLRTGTGLDRLADGRAVLTDGSAVEVDVVLVGVGAIAQDELARDAGLAVDNGVLVDAGLRTSAPDVFAAGDVANALHPILGERVRVEHWQNAVSQGQAAARALAGEPVSYDDLPYFFTDQYDLGLEYFGHVGSTGYDELVIEDGDADAFACFWSRAGRLLAAMHVNQWDRSDELRDRVRDRR